MVLFFHSLVPVFTFISTVIEIWAVGSLKIAIGERLFRLDVHWKKPKILRYFIILTGFIFEGNSPTGMRLR